MRFKKNIILIGLFLSLNFIFLEPNRAWIVDSYLNMIVDPFHTFFNLFYSWDNSTMLGHSNEWNHSYIFPFGFVYYFCSLFFNINITQTIIFALILWSGYYSFTIFIQNEFNNTSIYTYIGGLLYIFNLYTLTNLAGASVLLMPYIFLPLQLYFINKILLSQNFFKYSLGLAIATLFMSGINPTLIAINLVVISIYFSNLLIQNNLLNKYKQTLKKLAISFLVVFLINFYWIIGILSFFIGGSADMSAILSESLSMQNQAGSYLNVFRTLGLWAFGQGWNGNPYFNYSPTYLENSIWIFSMYLLPLISLSSLILIKKSKQIFWVLFLIILSIPMVVATNQGIFANLYAWAYSNVPLFSMFRSSYKFIQVYIFGLAILIVYLLINIRNIKLKNMLAIFLICLIIINAFPFFTGKIFEDNKKIQGIPNYYYDAQKFFEKDKSNYRIFLLPVQYFSVFTWGSTSGNPEFIWNKGLVARQPGSELEKSNKITLKLYDYILNNNYTEANKLFKELNIRYIVQRNDFDWNFYGSISQSPETIKNALIQYEKIETFGKLDIYIVPDNQTNTLFESINVYFSKINPSKYRLYFKGIKSKQNLSFLESFDKNWKLYIAKFPNNSCKPLKYYESLQAVECSYVQNFFEGEELSYFWDKYIFDETHHVIYEYANIWTIDPEYIKTNYPKEFYKENQDGTIEIEMILYFKPQSYFYLELIISSLTFAGCMVYLLFHWRKRKLKNTASPRE